MICYVLLLVIKRLYVAHLIFTYPHPDRSDDLAAQHGAAGVGLQPAYSRNNEALDLRVN